MAHNFPHSYPDIKGQDELMSSLMARLFPEKVERRKQGLCPFCGLPVDEQAFVKERDWREYLITGVCLPCQTQLDETLAEEPDVDTGASNV